MTSTDRFERESADERGVSPVIGVILMVAVTVILAAVLGTFVLDYGGRAGGTAPAVSLAVGAETATNNVTISHRGGDPLRAADTRVQVEKLNESGPEFARYDAATGESALSVGEEARVTMGSTEDGVDWPAGGPVEYTNGADEFGALSAGDRVTVTVIDTASQRVVFEATVTA